MKVVNLTPHIIRLNDGQEFPPSGQVARVTTAYKPWWEEDKIRLTHTEFGDVEGLPESNHDVDGSPILNREVTIYVVSAIVAAAVTAQGGDRDDVVSPATGHPECVRKDGQVWSVPGFIVA